MRVLLGLAAALAAGAAQAETVAVSAERMLDVQSGRMVERPLILVTDGKITAVGKQGELAVPTGAKAVDLAGLTLVPGLIEMHAHLDSLPEFGGYTGLQFSDAFWTVVSVRNAKDTLETGFTTARNVGSSQFADVGLREAIDNGYIVGPRLITAAYSFGATGGHCDSTYFPPSMKQRNEYSADTPDEARKSVRTLRKYGATVIKICATGGVFSRNTEPGQQQMTEAEMKAVVDEAHQWGLKVAAHAHGTSGIKAAIRAGVDTIEHASLIDDEGIRLAKEKGAYLSMDIYNTEYTQAEGKKNGVLEDNLRKDREIAEAQRQNFKRAHQAGAKMIYGTDTGVYPHKDSAKQFAVMVRYGMTPLQAIRSATITASEALGRSDVGAISVGRWGDMVAVAGDPTADVRVLEAPKVVIKGGEVVKDNR